MPLKIVRNDMTKMECDAIVNTASEYPAYCLEDVGAGTSVLYLLITSSL